MSRFIDIIDETKAEKPSLISKIKGIFIKTQKTDTFASVYSTLDNDGRKQYASYMKSAGLKANGPMSDPDREMSVRMAAARQAVKDTQPQTPEMIAAEAARRREISAKVAAAVARDAGMRKPTEADVIKFNEPAKRKSRDQER